MAGTFCCRAYSGLSARRDARFFGQHESPWPSAWLRPVVAGPWPRRLTIQSRGPNPSASRLPQSLVSSRNVSWRAMALRSFSTRCRAWHLPVGFASPCFRCRAMATMLGRAGPPGLPWRHCRSWPKTVLSWIGKRWTNCWSNPLWSSSVSPAIRLECSLIPSACCCSPAPILRVFFLVDEAFADFIPELRRLGGIIRPNLFVLHSLTKFYAMAGLRLGLGYGPADICAEIAALLPDWSVNAPALAVGLAALDDDDYARRTLAVLPELRERVAQRSCRVGHYGL